MTGILSESTKGLDYHLEHFFDFAQRYDRRSFLRNTLQAVGVLGAIALLPKALQGGADNNVTLFESNNRNFVNNYLLPAFEASVPRQELPFAERKKKWGHTTAFQDVSYKLPQHCECPSQVLMTVRNEESFDPACPNPSRFLTIYMSIAEHCVPEVFITRYDRQTDLVNSIIDDDYIKLRSTKQPTKYIDNLAGPARNPVVNIIHEPGVSLSGTAAEFGLDISKMLDVSKTTLTSPDMLRIAEQQQQMHVWMQASSDPWAKFAIYPIGITDAGNGVYEIPLYHRHENGVWDWVMTALFNYGTGQLILPNDPDFINFSGIRDKGLYGHIAGSYFRKFEGVPGFIDFHHKIDTRMQDYSFGSTVAMGEVVRQRFPVPREGQ